MSEPLTDAELDSAIEDCFYLSPTDIRHRVEKLVAEIRRLREENAEMVGALRAIWDTVPATYDPDDPMVRRHAAALNAAGMIVDTLKLKGRW